MTLLVIHFMATCFMAGVIWIVQVVHYPLFAQVGEQTYKPYQLQHMQRITWVVLPAMAIELITGIALLLPDGFEWFSSILEGVEGIKMAPTYLWTNLAGIAVIWVSTVFLQVPQHAKLTAGFDRKAHRKLVRGNWIRTITWSLRVLMLVCFIVSA